MMAVFSAAEYKRVFNSFSIGILCCNQVFDHRSNVDIVAECGYDIKSPVLITEITNDCITPVIEYCSIIWLCMQLRKVCLTCQ